MIRGTTPTLSIKLNQAVPFDTLYVTFAQGEKIVLERNLSQVDVETTIDETVISLTLTQEDTLELKTDQPVFVQIRGKVGDTAYATAVSDPSMRFRVQDILKKGTI